MKTVFKRLLSRILVGTLLEVEVMTTSTPRSKIETGVRSPNTDLVLIKEEVWHEYS